MCVYETLNNMKFNFMNSYHLKNLGYFTGWMASQVLEILNSVTFDTNEDF